MKKIKIIDSLYQAKEVIIFILITILYSIPLLKHLLPTYLFALNNDYFILKVIGIIGAYFLVFYIIFLFYKSENKKDLFKDLLPVFILLLYMIWSLISSIFSENKSLAFLGTFYRHDGYITYLLYAGCFGLSFGLKSTKAKKALLYIFTIIAIFSILLIELAKNSILIGFVCNLDISTASFFNSNHYGYYLLLTTAICSFLFITEHNKFLKILNLIMYSFLLYYLVLNNTFGCYIALITTLIIFLIISIIKKENKITYTIPIVIFILVSIFVTTNSNNVTTGNISSLTKDIGTLLTSSSQDKKWKKAGSGRMELWYYGLQFIIEKPILGYGPENLESKYLNLGINQDRPHNLIIQLATTSGIPGLILYSFAIGLILVRGIKRFTVKNQLLIICLFSVIAYLISAMFGNSMYYTSPYYFIILGFLFQEIVNLRLKN